MNLANAHRYFSSRFWCERGFHFNAQLLALPLELTSTYFNYPRRVLKMDADAPVVAGDIVRDLSGLRFLLSDHGPSEVFQQVIYKSMRAYQITHNATWVRRSTTTDPLTGTNRKAVTNTSVIPVVIEFQKTQEDEMRIPADLVRIIVGEDVQVNDTLDEFLVVNVEDQLGIKIATARRQ